MDDIHYINELKKGSNVAFLQLVNDYQQMVFNTVLNIVQHFHEAEDIAQEVFIQVFQSAKDFRGDSKLSTWIYRIAVTKSLDWERKKKAKKSITTLKNLVGIGKKEEDTLSNFHHPGIQLDQKDKASALFLAMKKLPENQRIAFVLIKADGLSYDEVSRIMQITVKAVEALMHRAKANLKKSLEGYYQQ